MYCISVTTESCQNPTQSDMFNFLKVLSSWSNDLVVKVLHSQSRGPGFKTTGWLEDQLSLSSFRGRSIEYLELVKK